MYFTSGSDRAFEQLMQGKPGFDHYDAVTFRVKGVVENMAVFRVERNKGYTVMSNHHLRNKDLSLINQEQIDAIRAAIRELEQAGYIVRSRERDSQGRLRGADYVIYEQPQPVPDSPTLGKPTQLNKDISSKEKSITDVSITDPIPILSRPSPLEDEAELARELPEITEGQTFDPVEASITEHFTTPPKPYTEDTLLSAMERAGAEEMPEDAEHQGLGTPATRASILEKLVQMGFVERKGKQLLPTKDGHNLVCVLPEVLTSPQLTAEWETKLTAIAKGEADPEGFMVGIEEMTRSMISRYSQISEDAQKLFQAERVVIGKCPRCGEAVYEGKKNYYCGNRACQFVMWKNDRFLKNGARHSP